MLYHCISAPQWQPCCPGTRGELKKETKQSEKRKQSAADQKHVLSDVYLNQNQVGFIKFSILLSCKFSMKVRCPQRNARRQYSERVS